jgi:hypothetical protein
MAAILSLNTLFPDFPNPPSGNLIDIGIASSPGSGIYDQIARISRLHIVRVENLQAA